MGEAEFERNVMVAAVQGALAEQAIVAEQEMRLTTPGGRYQAALRRWVSWLFLLNFLKSPACSNAGWRPAR